MTILLRWPDALDHLGIWAKSPDRGAGGKAETLAQHTYAVLERLADTVRLRPSLPEWIGVPRLWHILFWSAFLHDFGKSAQGFQNVLRGGPKWPYRHEVLSLAFVDWMAEGFNDEERRWLIAGVVSHHRDAKEILSVYGDDGEESVGATLRELVSEISDLTLDALWDWLATCPTNWVEALGLTSCGIAPVRLLDKAQAVRQAHERGADSIARCLRLYDRWLDSTLKHANTGALLVGTVLLRGHLISSDHMASAHVGELPKPQLANAQRLLQCWGWKEEDLRDHQREAKKAHGSAVLMAPTGSGKTEAALLWAVSQEGMGDGVPRLYYTLPFQASMNAMETRLAQDDEDGIRKAPFPGQVGLEHSRSALAYYRRLRDDDTYDPIQATQLARDLNDLARLNYYPVRVLSPYQLLKAPYGLKGFETLLTDCYGGAFVLDEVHAYEAGRLAKILLLVKYLRERYAAKFFVMSATLPKLLRERLAETLGDHTLITASDRLYAEFRRHEAHLTNGDLLDAPNLDDIAQAALEGQFVLVCCNTVPRAQEAWDELRKRLGNTVKVELLHGRFNGRDRLEKENIVRQSTGSRSLNRQRLVLVATQVVEVSLDIDLDLIYTDPAPLEALLQRFGRVNRRKLKATAPVYVFREPVPEKPRPYQPELIQAALRVLTNHDGYPIDEAQVSNWLDEVYEEPQIAAQWMQDYDREAREFANFLLDLRAFQSTDNDELFYKAFDSVEVLPEGVLNDYISSREQSYLDAIQWLVPVRHQQYARLYREGKAFFDDKLKVRLVNVYYDEKVGLDFAREAREKPDDLWESD